MNFNNLLLRAEIQSSSSVIDYHLMKVDRLRKGILKADVRNVWLFQNKISEEGWEGGEKLLGVSVLI